MTHQGHLFSTMIAGAAGALVATLAVGSSLLLVIPAAIGIGAIAFAFDHSPAQRRSPTAPTGTPTAPPEDDDEHDRAA